ncbi:MAG: ArsR family transcriptional regulator [Methylotenera sp.]|jgi:predicted transcriptional regulator|nr:helix-turn-helix transcriptional regulator [Methylotenera sp.]
MKIIHTIPNEWQNIAHLFIALGDAHRQRILLAFEKNERLSILQITAASTLSRTAVMHHLKILHQSGALQSEKIGKEVYFWVNKSLMTTAIKDVLNYIETEI